MKSTTLKLFMICAIVIIQACSAAPATEVLHITEPITQVPGTPVVQVPTKISATLVVNSGTESAPPTQSIQHTNIPVNLLPGVSVSHAADFDSSKVSLTHPVVGGDRFTTGQLERPFNANTMTQYFPGLDIVDVQVFEDDFWIYGAIQLTGRETDRTLTRSYALELDPGHDGRGDWLVLASNPLSTDWSVEGVQVYHDSNGDVGNVTAMYTDANVTLGDGFETRIFEQGIGDDPDLAWARTSPMDPNIIQIAVKRSALGNPKSYMIGMWAGSSLLDPALFDVNDFFTHEQAGSADPSFAYYPIKAVAEVDNTCRMAVGYQTGKETGLCSSLSPVASDQNRAGAGNKGGGSDNGSDGSGSDGGNNGGSNGGGNDPGPGICPPCPDGMDQNPYPDCTCYTS